MCGREVEGRNKPLVTCEIQLQELPFHGSDQDGSGFFVSSACDFSCLSTDPSQFLMAEHHSSKRVYCADYLKRRVVAHYDVTRESNS